MRRTRESGSQRRASRTDGFTEIRRADVAGFGCAAEPLVAVVQRTIDATATRRPGSLATRVDHLPRLVVRHRRRIVQNESREPTRDRTPVGLDGRSVLELIR